MFLFTLCTAQAEGAPLFCKGPESTTFLGFRVPIVGSSPFPAILVLLLTPLQLALLPDSNRSVSTNLLISLGLVAASLCFAVLLPTTLWPGRVSMAWLAASLYLFVLAELLITPLASPLLPTQCASPLRRTRRRTLVRSRRTRLLHRRRSRRTLVKLADEGRYSCSNCTPRSGRGRSSWFTRHRAPKTDTTAP